MATQITALDSTEPALMSQRDSSADTRLPTDMPETGSTEPSETSS